MLIDFSKAFDSVDYKVLLDKLRNLNMSDLAIAWFESYLHGRSQRVVVNGITSKWGNISRGVPQGTILSPILFSVHINTLPSCLKKCQVHLFADDVQIYLPYSPRTFSQSITDLNADLQNIASWSLMNGLTINPAKTQCILISSPHIINQLQSPESITFCNTNLEYSTTVKNLGLIMDNTLNWDSHINSIIKKVFYALSSIRQFKYTFPNHIKFNLVKSLIIPIFDYCDVVYNSLNVAQKHKLDKALNSCIRFAFNLTYYEHITPHYIKNNILKLSSRRDLHSVCLVHKILIKQTPKYLYRSFIPLNQIHTHNSRHSNLINIPFHTTSYLSSSFPIQGARLYNNVTDSIKNSASINLFVEKSKLAALEIQRSNV